MYKLNLLPKELQPGNRRLSRLVIILLTVYFLAVIAVFVPGSQKALALKEEYAQLQAELCVAENQLNQSAALQAQKLHLMERVQALREPLNDRILLRGMLEDVVSILPSDAFLTGVDILQGSGQEDLIRLEGRSASMASVGVYVEKISMLEYVSDVELLGLHEQGETSQEHSPVAFKIIAHMDEVKQ